MAGVQQNVALADRIGGPADVPAHGGQKKDRKRGQKGGQKRGREQPAENGAGGSGGEFQSQVEADAFMARLIARLAELFGDAAIADADDTVSLGGSEHDGDVNMEDGSGGQGGGAFDGIGFCGFMSIISSMRYCLGPPDSYAPIWAALAFMPFGLFFDFMDGKVARWRKKSSLMGQELDSLADLVR